MEVVRQELVSAGIPVAVADIVASNQTLIASILTETVGSHVIGNIYSRRAVEELIRTEYARPILDTIIDVVFSEVGGLEINEATILSAIESAENNITFNDVDEIVKYLPTRYDLSDRKRIARHFFENEVCTRKELNYALESICIDLDIIEKSSCVGITLEVKCATCGITKLIPLNTSLKREYVCGCGCDMPLDEETLELAKKLVSIK